MTLTPCDKIDRPTESRRRLISREVEVKVLVGGAPVTQEYCDKMGADGYAATASATVHLARALMVSMGYDISSAPAVSADTEAVVAAVEGLMQTWDEVESGAQAMKTANAATN